MAEDSFGTWSRVHAQELGADGHAAVHADPEVGAQAPDKGPPRAVGHGLQSGAFFFERKVPGLLGFHFEFAVDFMLVTMEAQGLDMRIGLVEVGDIFAGEVSGQSFLPEEVGAFDFAFGLRGGGIAEGDAVEEKSPAQLGKRVWGMGEEEAVEIDIDFQGHSKFEEGGGQKIKVSQEVFGLVDFGAGEDAAAIIEHIDHGKGSGAAREPVMGRGVQLPEFADAAALPAPDGS